MFLHEANQFINDSLIVLFLFLIISYYTSLYLMHVYFPSIYLVALMNPVPCLRLLSRSREFSYKTDNREQCDLSGIHNHPLLTCLLLLFAQTYLTFIWNKLHKEITKTVISKTVRTVNLFLSCQLRQNCCDFMCRNKYKSNVLHLCESHQWWCSLTSSANLV